LRKYHHPGIPTKMHRKEKTKETKSCRLNKTFLQQKWQNDLMAKSLKEINHANRDFFSEFLIKAINL